MGSQSRICEICGVRERQRPGFFANFPINEQRCRHWVQIVGKEDLLYIPIEKLHKVRFICGDHFIPKDFNKKGNRLKKRAYPKLHLSALPLSETLMKDFPLHVASKTGPVPTSMESEASGVPIRSRRPLATLTTHNIMETPAASTGTETLPTPWKHKRLETMDGVNCRHIDHDHSYARVQHYDHTYARHPDTDENLDTAATTCMESETVAAAPAASTSTETLPTPRKYKRPATTCMESETIAAAPAASTSTETLPTPRKYKRPATSCMESDTAASPSTVPLLTTRTHKRSSATKDQLVLQLRRAKATVKSLERNASLIDRIDSAMVREIVTSALKNQRRKPQGQRYTKDYKLSCLAIFKRSPKAYRYLRHLVPVPSIKTLQNMLKNVPMDTGICKPVLEHLGKVAKRFKAKHDNHCVLLFDEMALKPRINYSTTKDHVEGYTDMGNSERTKELADHALVFMLQGIRKKFKQPLAFYFVKGTVTSAKLATIIKDIVTTVNETGFRVLATVCDQGPTNLGALKILKNATPTEQGTEVKNFFSVNDKKVYIIYDVPHLFKSIRNNLMTHGTLVIMGKKVKWEHLVMVEKYNRNFTRFNNITENIVSPKYRAKMKVKYAAQALSNSMGGVLKLVGMATTDERERRELIESGEVVQDLNRLFDFTNGPSGENDVKIGIRQNPAKNTNHVQEWAEYRKKLETLSFIKSNGDQVKNVKCVQGYMTTLCSFRDLWLEVKNLKFRYLNLRQLNQDALENLFGVIRQHSPTNRNPTVSSFVAALKSSIVSGLSAPHSRGSNCEKDSLELLTDLKNLVFGKNSDMLTTSSQDEVESNITEVERVIQNHDEYMDGNSVPLLSLPDDTEDLESRLLTLEGQPIVYISGYLAKRALQSHTCITCKNSLTTETPADNPIYSYIRLKEWWPDKQSLTYPSIELCKYVEQCCGVFEHQVIPILHQENIVQLTLTMFMMSTDVQFIACDLHRNIICQRVSTLLAILCVRRQCQRVNLKIAALEENLADQTKKAQQQGIAK